MTDSFGFSNRDPAQFANRIEPIKQDLESSNDPEDLMLMIMDAINDTVTPIPEVGKFYTFVYNAKTPGKQYDQHPLIACTELKAPVLSGPVTFVEIYVVDLFSPLPITTGAILLVAVFAAIYIILLSI